MANKTFLKACFSHQQHLLSLFVPTDKQITFKFNRKLKS